MKNKVSKYVLYAIGEIILVVIGIIIALQINTWNNERLDRQNERLYLTEIEGSLESDSIQISSILEFNKGKLVIVDNLSQIFNDTLNNDQRAQIFSKNSNPFTQYRVFEPSEVAFNNMLESEGIKIIRDRQLRKDLSTYYETKYEAGVQWRIVEMNRKTVDEFYPYFITREWLQTNKGIRSEIPSNKDSEVHQNQRLISNLYGITYIIKVQNEFLKEVLNQNILLRKRIGKQYRFKIGNKGSSSELNSD